MNTTTNIKTNFSGMDSDVVIHLGAGLGISTSLYESLGFKKLILVEISAELSNLLLKKFTHTKNVWVKKIAISAQNDFIEFFNYSKTRYGSQLELEPTFIQNSNLHFVEKTQIPAIPFAQLIAELQVDKTQCNTLIVELNGYEAQFIADVPLLVLNNFRKIIVSLQATARYINQTDQLKLCAVLAEKGFRLDSTESNQFIFKQDEHLITLLAAQTEQEEVIKKLMLEREQLTNKIQLVEKESDDLMSRNQKHKDWVESLKQEVELLKKNQLENERSQSLALKLQAKAQVDLENLRNQYQQKLHNEQKLVDLIKELQLKLKAAANYYHKLQILHPEFNQQLSVSIDQAPNDETVIDSDQQVANTKTIQKNTQASKNKQNSKTRRAHELSRGLKGE